MDIVSFKEAAILSYLSMSRRLTADDRLKLKSGLSKNALQIAEELEAKV